MSMQALQQFREKVNANPVLEGEVNAWLGDSGINLNTGPVNPGAVSEAIVALGKRHGFDFSADELLAVFGGPASSELGDELSDLELELVAAGNPINCNDENGGNG